jgi:uncharacterized membrane protein
MNYAFIPDIFAVFWFLVCWRGYALFAERMSKRKHSLLLSINEFRLNWMRQMLGRDNRMMDAALIGNLLRSISFFASTTIFIVLGLFTLIKYRDEASGILVTIPYAVANTPMLWEAKVFLLVVIFVYTFFKFTWSLRQYNYVCAVIGAAPPASEKGGPHSEQYAKNAAALISNAAKHFNFGLRGYYFGLAALSWFVNAQAFILASTFVVGVLYRREFRSLALQYLDATVFHPK